MTAIYTRNLREDLTYWPPGEATGLGGFTEGTPQNIKGRWQERSTLFLGVDGEEQVANSAVYVSIEVKRGGFLARGSNSPRVNAHEILHITVSPSLRNDQKLIKALL